MHAGKKSISGFTLIEMSLVIVVIGLIIAGILVGADMIRSAEIRSQVSQLQEINQATNNFKMKYNGLPGDLTDACTIGFSCASATTRGNGIIDDQNADTPIREVGAEPILFFTHLNQANILSPQYMPGNDSDGNCTGSSKTRFPMALSINHKAGMIGTTIGSKNYLFLGIVTCPNGIVWLGGMSSNGSSPNGVMSGAQASAIDIKIDDGVPNTGSVFATKLSSAAAGTCSGSCLDGTIDNTASQCVTSAASTAYNVTNNVNWCRLLVKLQ